jgi:hypothetical protein
MGGSSSKSNVDIVNNAIISAVISAAQNCSGSLNANQEVVHSGFGLFTGAQQNVTVSTSCLQKVVVDDTLISQMAENITQQAQANSQALLPAFSSADANTNLKNYLKTSVTTSFVQNCAAAVNANQQAVYGGIQVGVVDSQNINYFQTCMSNALNSNNVAQGIVATTNTGATAKASADPLADISNMLSSISMMWAMVIFGFILFIGVIGWLVFGGGGGGSETEVVRGPPPGAHRPPPPPGHGPPGAHMPPGEMQREQEERREIAEERREEQSSGMNPMAQQELVRAMEPAEEMASEGEVSQVASEAPGFLSRAGRFAEGIGSRALSVGEEAGSGLVEVLPEAATAIDVAAIPLDAVGVGEVIQGVATPIGLAAAAYDARE